MKLKRRHFILGAMVVGWAGAPVRQHLTTDKPLAAIANRYPLNGWLKIGPDNGVSVVVASAEMGQGIHTGLAMVLADELDADWATVTIEGFDREIPRAASARKGCGRFSR